MKVNLHLRSFIIHLFYDGKGRIWKLLFANDDIIRQNKKSKNPRVVKTKCKNDTFIERCGL